MTEESKSGSQNALPTIAWLINGDESFGVKRSISSLAGALTELGCAPRVLALRDGLMTDTLRTSGISVTVINAGERPPYMSGGLFSKATLFVRQRKFLRKLIPQIEAFITDVKPDILHFGTPDLLWIAGPAARHRRLPVSWQLSNVINQKYPLRINQRLYQWACSRYQVLPLPNSQFTAATLGPTRIPSRVLYLGVDTGQFQFNEQHRQHIRRSLGIPDEAIVLGTIARILPDKGQLELVQAIEKLRDQFNNVWVLLLGNGEQSEYASRIMHAARDAGFANRVLMPGTVHDTERYYSAIDLYVSSHICAEAFGLSIIEAMACERPVLVHNYAGPAETVIHQKTGWHYTPNTPDEIARQIANAIEQRHQWPQFGANGRAHVMKDFSLAAVANNFLSTIQTYIAQTKAR